MDYPEYVDKVIYAYRNRETVSEEDHQKAYKWLLDEWYRVYGRYLSDPSNDHYEDYLDVSADLSWLEHGHGE